MGTELSFVRIYLAWVYSSPNIFLYLVYACVFVSLDVQHLNCFDFLNSDRFYLFADLEGMNCFSFSGSKIEHTLLTLHDAKSVKDPPPHTHTLLQKADYSLCKVFWCAHLNNDALFLSETQ